LAHGFARSPIRTAAIAISPDIGWRRAELDSGKQDIGFMAGMERPDKISLLDTTRCSTKMSTPGESISEEVIPENN
jgi:hypothetical protein